MPRCVVALLVALGLAGPAGLTGGGQAAAEGGIDAAGQVFFTFDFGDGAAESPRFGLRLGLQSDGRSGTPDPDPFVSAMSLRFAMTGPAEVSLGGLTLPLGFGLSEGGRPDDAGKETIAFDYAPAGYAGTPGRTDMPPLVTAAGPAGRNAEHAPRHAAAMGLEATVAPSAGTFRRPESATRRWRFRALLAAAPHRAAARRRAEEGAAGKAVAFSHRLARPAGKAETVVARGRWRFRAENAGRAVAARPAFGRITRPVLPHRDAGGLHARRQTAPRAVAPQAVQAAGRQETKDRSQAAVERRRPERWLFRHVAWQPPPGREPAFAAFEGNPMRPKRGHLPIR